MKKRAVHAFLAVFLFLPLLWGCATSGKQPEGNADDFYARALRASEDRDYKLVVEYCTQTIRLNPMHQSAYKLRGAAYGLLQKWDESIDDFSKALEFSPGDAPTLEVRGHARMQKAFSLTKKDPDAAVQLLILAVMDFDKACKGGQQDACRTLNEINSVLESMKDGQ